MVSLLGRWQKLTQDRRDVTFPARVHQFSSILLMSEVTDGVNASLGLEAGMVAALATLLEARSKNACVFVVGNGGSAAVASHAVIDLINVAKLRAFTLHEPAVLTCMVNDYGYENAYSTLLERLAKPGDVLIAISSSGRSMIIRNAAAHAASIGAKVITLSGFAPDNPLRTLGAINIWLDSSDYGMVEVGHQFVLHNLSDRFGATYASQSL